LGYDPSSEPGRVQAKAKAMARGIFVWVMITVAVTAVYILYGMATVGSTGISH